MTNDPNNTHDDSGIAGNDKKESPHEWQRDWREFRREQRAERREERREARRVRYGTSPVGNGRIFGAVEPRLVIGLLVIALGFIYLIGNIGLIDTTAPIRYFWPAAFIAIGVALLITPGKVSSKQWGAGWILLGVWNFAYHARWIDFDIWSVAFPLALLVIGARLVQRAMNTPSDSNNGTTQSSGAESRIFALLSGSETRRFTQPIRDTDVTSILSGVKLDLTSAQLDAERVTLQVTVVMGGVEIYAPSEWTIVSEVSPILGAFIDKRRPATTLSTKTLYITGVVVMGGVEVKN